MDPLSVSASIFGIVAAAAQVSSLLKPFVNSTKDASSSAMGVLMEITDIRVCLNQLRGFLLGTQDAPRSRASLIMIEQVIIVLTDCVTIFSELEQTLEMLKTDQPMRVIDKVKWSMKETVISKILLRLQASKASLNLMLTTLTCSSVDEAHTSVRNLTSLVQQVLKSNLDMSRRLRNLERLHPALASSISQSPRSTRIASERDGILTPRQSTFLGFTFEDDLWTSPVYKKAALNASKPSVSSSHGSRSAALSFLSGLSLSDVSNVSAVFLPILSKELWNHHHYDLENSMTPGVGASLFDAWYNPPAKKSAFIRTVYFNGQYTNQYAQSKSTGHLIYRRFNVSGPQGAPLFVEGAVMARTSHVLAPEAPEVPVSYGKVDDVTGDIMSQSNKCTEKTPQGIKRGNYKDSIRISLLVNPENSKGWRQGVMNLLKEVPY